MVALFYHKNFYLSLTCIVTYRAIKGKEVVYEERFYFCANADEDENEFENGAMTNEKLLNARNAYRVKMGLLTSDEIVAIRESYGLSQVDLAKLLGWGEATISRYESKAIQDEAYDTMLLKSMFGPFFKKDSMLCEDLIYDLEQFKTFVAPNTMCTNEFKNENHQAF